MIPLYICGNDICSGKSTLALGMGRGISGDGYRVGYFKPVGWRPVQPGGETWDLDAGFMKSALDLGEPLEQICPVVMTQGRIQAAYEGKMEGISRVILDSFHRVSQDKDIMLVEGGGSLFEGGFVGARGIELAAAIDAKILFIDRYRDGIATIESFLDARELVGERFLGGVVNRVPPDKIEFVRKKVLPFLENQGIEVWGLIPEDKVLGAVRVSDLVEILPGSVICREDRLGELVEGFMVGAMSPENALRYFQQENNIAVITGGDRPEIQLAALEASVKTIVLTGGFHPHEIIVARAEERGVPLILVDHDTFSVMEHLVSTLCKLPLREEEKIGRAEEIVHREIDLRLLYKKLGFSPE